MHASCPSHASFVVCACAVRASCRAGKDSIEKVKHRRPTVATEHLIGKTERRQARISDSMRVSSALKHDTGGGAGVGGGGRGGSNGTVVPGRVKLLPAPPLPPPPEPPLAMAPLPDTAMAGEHGANLGELWRAELTKAWGSERLESLFHGTALATAQPQLLPPQLSQVGSSMPDADTASDPSTSSSARPVDQDGGAHVPKMIGRVHELGALDA